MVNARSKVQRVRKLTEKFETLAMVLDACDEPRHARLLHGVVADLRRALGDTK